MWWVLKGLLAQNRDTDAAAVHIWGPEEGHLNQHMSLDLGPQFQGQEAEQHHNPSPTQGYKQSQAPDASGKTPAKVETGKYGQGPKDPLLTALFTSRGRGKASVWGA